MLFHFQLSRDVQTLKRTERHQAVCLCASTEEWNRGEVRAVEWRRGEAMQWMGRGERREAKVKLGKGAGREGQTSERASEQATSADTSRPRTTQAHSVTRHSRCRGRSVVGPVPGPIVQWKHGEARREGERKRLKGVRRRAAVRANNGLHANRTLLRSKERHARFLFTSGKAMQANGS